MSAQGKEKELHRVAVMRMSEDGEKVAVSLGTVVETVDPVMGMREHGVNFTWNRLRPDWIKAHKDVREWLEYKASDLPSKPLPTGDDAEKVDTLENVLRNAFAFDRVGDAKRCKDEKCLRCRLLDEYDRVMQSLSEAERE